MLSFLFRKYNFIDNGKKLRHNRMTRCGSYTTIHIPIKICRSMRAQIRRRSLQTHNHIRSKPHHKTSLQPRSWPPDLLRCKNLLTLNDTRVYFLSRDTDKKCLPPSDHQYSPSNSTSLTPTQGRRWTRQTYLPFSKTSPCFTEHLDEKEETHILA